MSTESAVPETVFEHLRKTHFILTVTCGALLYVAWAAAPTWVDSNKLGDIQRFGHLVERYRAYAGSESDANGLCSSVMTREAAAAELRRFGNDLAATVASIRRTPLIGEGPPSTRAWSSAEPAPRITGALATPKVDCASFSVPRTVGQFRQAWNEERMTVMVGVPVIPRGPELTDALLGALPGAEFSETPPRLREIEQAQANGGLAIRLRVEYGGTLIPVDLPVLDENRAVDLRVTVCGNEAGSRFESRCDEVDALERMFPFAMELASQSDHVALADFKKVVEGQIEKGPPAVKLFDNEVSGRNVRLVGVLVLLAIQLYQLAHVQHFHGGRTLACTRVAWIALYPSSIGRTLTLLTMWVIPALTVGILAFSPGSDWMQVPLLALAAFATSLIAGWLTLAHVVPRADTQKASAQSAPPAAAAQAPATSVTGSPGSAAE